MENSTSSSSSADGILHFTVDLPPQLEYPQPGLFEGFLTITAAIPTPGTGPLSSSWNFPISIPFPTPSTAEPVRLNLAVFFLPNSYQVVHATDPAPATLSAHEVSHDIAPPDSQSVSEIFDEMADPFEVRMRFTNQLRQLNASVSSAQKAAQLALKYRDMAEDLHSCILEQVERNNMNTRANIMYFIEHFLDMAQRDGHRDYIRMMQRDIIRVVDAVAPDDGSGAANVKVARKVIQALHTKSFLDAQVVVQIEEVLKERDSAAQDLALSSPGSNDTMVGDGMAPSQTMQPPRRGNAMPRPDRKQIEQRIEEDRERHKRLRETMWAVPSGSRAEMEKLWDETSDLGEDDFRAMEEEQLEWERNHQNSCPHRREAAEKAALEALDGKQSNGKRAN